MKTLRDTLKQKARSEQAEQHEINLAIQKDADIANWLQANPQIGVLIRKGKAVYYNSTTLELIRR